MFDESSRSQSDEKDACYDMEDKPSVLSGSLNDKGESSGLCDETKAELEDASSDTEFEHMKRQIKWLYIWLYVCLGTLNPFIAGYFYEVLHLSTNAVGFLNGLSPMMNLIAAPILGYLADRLTSNKNPSSSSSGNPQARKYILLLVLTMTTVADLSMALYKRADSSVIKSANNAGMSNDKNFWILVALRLWSAIFYSSVKGLIDSYTIGCLSDFTPDASKMHGKLARTWGEVATGITSATVGQLIYSTSAPGATPRFELAFGLRAFAFIPLAICLLSIRQKSAVNKQYNAVAENYDEIPPSNLPVQSIAVLAETPSRNLLRSGSTNGSEGLRVYRIPPCGTPELLNDDGHACSAVHAPYSRMQTIQSEEDCDNIIENTNSVDTEESDIPWSSHAQISPPPDSSRLSSTAPSIHLIHHRNHESSSSCESQREARQFIDSCSSSHEIVMEPPRQPPPCGSPFMQGRIISSETRSRETNGENGEREATQWNKIIGFFVLVFANGFTCRYIETFASICIRQTAKQSLSRLSTQMLLETPNGTIPVMYNKLLLHLDAGRVMSSCRICLSVGGTFAYYYLTPWLLHSGNDCEDKTSKSKVFWNVYRLNGLTVILYGLCSVLYGSETLIGCFAAEALRGITYAVQWTACTHHVQTLSIRGAGRSTLQTLLEAVYKGLGASIGCMLGGNLLGHFNTLHIAFWEMGKYVMMVGCTLGLLAESMCYINTLASNRKIKFLVGNESSKSNAMVELYVKKHQ